MRPTKWAVIENAGYDGECVMREFHDSREAWRWVDHHYGQGAERERLHVDVAHWDSEGEFWSYDH